jgi:transcriptional regulator with GAF, ATPase, and Fis domain
MFETGSATPQPLPPPSTAGGERAVLPRLTALAEELVQNRSLEQVLERLVDEAVTLTHADKGLLLLLDSGEPQVRVARTQTRTSLENALHRVSDSVVSRVVETRKPLLVHDAVGHPDFKAAESVVNLRLLSIICVPLLYRDELLGLLYVGNDERTHRFNQEDLELTVIFAAQASLLLQNALLLNELKVDNTQLRRQLEDQRYGDLLGTGPAMRDLFRRIDKVAGTDLSVLISGETGTGKELIAREIHRRSGRAKGPFIAVNCGAIPENLLESELFGHVRGAFTGATSNRAGRFQLAGGGTLFLDEVGELPLNLQVKLLRALQDRVVHRVGDSKDEAVDIRVLAASHRVLEQEVQKGTFREDLFYRLNVIYVTLPPLRERGEDIMLLAKFFLQRYAQEFAAKARGFSPGALAALKRHRWPGNVRELENRLKRAVVLADRPLLTAEDLDLGTNTNGPAASLAQATEDFKRRYIDEVLDRCGGNRTRAAKELGVDPRTIFRHLERKAGDEEETP